MRIFTHTTTQRQTGGRERERLSLFFSLHFLFAGAHVCACGLHPRSSFYPSIRLPSVVCDRLVVLMPIEQVEQRCCSGRTCGRSLFFPLPILQHILHIVRAGKVVCSFSVTLSHDLVKAIYTKDSTPLFRPDPVLQHMKSSS